MALKTVLGQVIIWCDKDHGFDTSEIANIRNDELKYWGEIEKINPPVKKFSNGENTENCIWYRAKIITDISEKQLEAPHICSSRMALSRALDSTPENVSYRWKRE